MKLAIWVGTPVSSPAFHMLKAASSGLVRSNFCATAATSFLASTKSFSALARFAFLAGVGSAASSWAAASKASLAACPFESAVFSGSMISAGGLTLGGRLSFRCINAFQYVGSKLDLHLDAMCHQIAPVLCTRGDQRVQQAVPLSAQHIDAMLLGELLVIRQFARRGKFGERICCADNLRLCLPYQFRHGQPYAGMEGFARLDRLDVERHMLPESAFASLRT